MITIKEIFGFCYYRYITMLNYVLFLKNKKYISPGEKIFANQIKELESIGHSKIEGLFTKEAYALRQIFEKFLINGDPNDFNPIRISNESLSVGDLRHPTEKDFKKGISSICNYISISSPERIEIIREISRSRELKAIASNYFQNEAILESINFRKSFVNNFASSDTQIWHTDKNAHKILKFFIYCNDVDHNSGPFSFIEHTHRKIYNRLKCSHRIPDYLIERFYSKNEIKELLGNSGDLLMVDTKGIHRGVKPTKNERILLTISYTCP